ncbi:MAG: N-acetylmuramoyl-L-alanine amidase [Mucinivorans sp.]
MTLTYRHITTLLLLLVVPMVILGATKEQQNTVVIDAGHGGKDPGATSGKVYEKSINLAVALELGRLLHKAMPSLNVIYTRSDDRFIELSERSNIANRASADLFISIHTNASESSTPYGTETYIMGPGKGQDNLKVAMRENGVVSLEADYTERYEGYEPNSSESLIIFSLMQYAYAERSGQLAQTIQRLYAKSELKDKGVKQAGFLVLWRTAMPSVLTEVGFISNSSDRAFLTSKNGVTTIAECLCGSVVEFFKEQKSGYVSEPTKTTTTQVVPSQQKEVVYKVQVKSSRSPLSINSGNFGRYVMQVEQQKIGNLYKFYIGEVVSYKEALNLQAELRKTFNDCFVVAFDQGTQISLEKARNRTR